MQNNIALQDEPTVKKDRKLIDALRKSKVYRQYETVFTQATGLPLALRPTESFDLPFHGRKNENPFCAFLADRKGGCTFCLETQERLARNARRQACTTQCPFGLTETRVPVHLGERLVGYLHVGQVFTQAPLLETFKKAVVRLFPNGSAPERKMLELWKKTPQIPAEKYAATVALLKFFAKQLSSLSNQIVIKEANVEPPVVQKAREYIDNHKMEPLSLSAVARAAGASVFHFCKIFHRSTGTNFTDYVARARIQDAKGQLMNPNRRISEIAYDVGFQSLTQFNRTFRRIFGQSPSEYRENAYEHATMAA